MSPREIADVVQKGVPVLRADMSLREALPLLLDAGLPALPVVGDDDKYAGIFGERELISAVFPGYVQELPSASFVHRSIEDTLEKRSDCVTETVGQHMNTEHIDVPPDFADIQLAETFLHHRVLIVPVTDEGTVVGVVARSDFFRALSERVLDL
jgi:CBS domain-containing protein